jgi:hypothetical protein
VGFEIVTKSMENWTRRIDHLRIDVIIHVSTMGREPKRGPRKSRMMTTKPAETALEN